MISILSSVRFFLATHDHPDKLLVVHVTLGVLLVGQQLLHLIIGQLLAQSGQQMAKFGGRNEA